MKYVRGQFVVLSGPDARTFDDSIFFEQKCMTVAMEI